jgi:hypothetical protein
MEGKRPGVWNYFVARIKGEVDVCDLGENNYAHPEFSVACRMRGGNVEGRGSNGFTAYLAMLRVLAR